MAAAAPSITSMFKEKEGERVSTSEFSCLFTFHQEARYYPRSPSDDLPLGVIGQRRLPLVPRKVNVCLSNLYTVKQLWERRLTVAFWQQPKISTTRWVQIFFSSSLVIVMIVSGKKNACSQPLQSIVTNLKWMHPSLLVPILYIKKPYYYSFPQAGLLTRRVSTGCIDFLNQFPQ